MRHRRRETPDHPRTTDRGRHRARHGMILLACWLAAGATAPATAAEPFGPTDLDAVYSDQARIHYRIDRSCLADLATCLGEPGLTSPCGLSDAITGDACYSGVHRFCAAKGHLSGFGVEDPTDPSTIDVTCVGAGSAALIDVGDAELAAMNSPCTGATSSAACGVAIDRWCRARAPWALGFGPVETGLSSGPPTKSQLPADTARIVCVETDVSQTFAAPLAPCLAGGSNTPVSSACRQAMDDHCRQQSGDLRGGIGFRERGVDVDFGCIERLAPWQPNSQLPAAPALPVDVNDREWNSSGAKPGSDLVHNALAPNRSTSFDGRIKLAFRQDIDGINYMSFRVQTPEIFDAPLTQDQGPGRDRSFELYGWAAFYGFDVPEHDANGDGIFHGSGGGTWKGKSSAICDPHQDDDGDPEAENRQQSVPGRVSNPFACTATGGSFGAALDHDCYDLTIVTVYSDGPDEIWGAPVRVVVTNPKGAGVNSQSSLDTRAHVVHVESIGAPRQATFDPGDPHSIFEPTISGDGRLIVINGPVGRIRYAVMPESATPCDVTQWTAFKQLHQMHADPDMADYGIARYPIRDHEGELLGTRKVTGSYPWLDRDGDTLMWMAASAPLYYVDSQEVAHEKFEIVSHPHDCDGPTPPNFDCDRVYLHPADMAEVQASTDAGNRLGMSVLGLWTHGKMVSPDNRNNAADFGLQNSKYQWRNVRLYSDVPEGTLVGGTIHFTVSSTENQFFFHSNLRLDVPREVAWFVSNERQTDEVVFDDVLDPMALVASPMNPSIQPGSPDNRGRFQDGFLYTGNYRGEGFQKPAHIANAATSVSEEVVQAASQPGVDYSDNLQWNIPPYGYLLGGARAEPIAAGGTRGHGLWLDGAGDRLEYLVPEQAAERIGEMADAPWLTSVAIDPRDLSFRRRLLTLPDGSWLDVVGPRSLELGSTDNAWTQLIAIPAELELTAGRWSALAVVSTAAPSLDVYLDGYLLASYTPNASVFRMGPGRITLGAPFTGFTGWVDDFKVIAGVSSSQIDAPEIICNHARGTLVGLEPDDPPWRRAGAYPDASHQAIAAWLPQSQQFSRYACERPIDDPVDGVDRADHDHYMCLGQTRRMDAESNPECVRDSLLFPEGPLFFDLPRPDSLANSFCLSCHRDSHPSATMRADEALSPGLIVMHRDVRRQPMQNSPKIFSFIPAGLIEGEPATDVVTPVDGIFLDQYTTPSSDDP